MAAPSGAEHTHTVNETNSDRIPTLEDVKQLENSKEFSFIEENYRFAVDMNPPYKMKPNYVLFNHFGYKEDLSRRVALKREYSFYNYCFVSVCLSFILGLVIGVAIMGAPPSSADLVPRRPLKMNSTRDIRARSLNSLKFSSDYRTINDLPSADKDKDSFATVSFTGAVVSHERKKDAYPKTLTEDMKEILKDNKNVHHEHSISGVLNETYVPNELTVLYDDIYWGPAVEAALPAGYGARAAAAWERYVARAEAVRMEPGCGRMQNRLVTFRDGGQACVRYRQNTDQIQGEIFSFYVARLLNLTNLAPSAVRVVDLKDRLWRGVASDVAAAQWNTNRAVVLTQYIPGLEAATIPAAFKPAARHLNKIDVMRLVRRENDTVETSERLLIDKLKLKNAKNSSEGTEERFDHVHARLTSGSRAALAELAQWSDLIVFDYLTANLDRIVNNLFNEQWNANIMEGPAHNLARQGGGLLVFLDNESGLLHGYRLLGKYEAYHALLLDALCAFRRRTVAALRRLHAGGGAPVGAALADLFRRHNDAVIRDVLPPLPDKNAKILHDRIGKVLAQVDRCKQTYGNRS